MEVFNEDGTGKDRKRHPETRAVKKYGTDCHHWCGANGDRRVTVAIQVAVLIAILLLLALGRVEVGEIFGKVFSQ